MRFGGAEAAAAFLDEEQSQIRSRLSLRDELKNRTESSCENIKYGQSEGKKREGKKKDGRGEYKRCTFACVKAGGKKIKTSGGKAIAWVLDADK